MHPVRSPQQEINKVECICAVPACTHHEMGDACAAGGGGGGRAYIVNQVG